MWNDAAPEPRCSHSGLADAFHTGDRAVRDLTGNLPLTRDIYNDQVPVPNASIPLRNPGFCLAFLPSGVRVMLHP